MATLYLYGFQKSINKGNTVVQKVNGSLLKFTYFCPNSCPRSCLCFVHPVHREEIHISSPLCPVRNAKCRLSTVNVVSWFGKEQNNVVSQSKLFDTIARHSIEISENDVMTYQNLTTELPLLTWLTLSGISNPLPGLTPGTAFRDVGSGTIPHDDNK